ncbi:MAG: glycosyltransferase [bacterium]|nr:glycosyltransferase [bacterium]
MSREGTPDFVFLNQVALAPIASHVKRRVSGETGIVLLSHGLESTDLLHRIRLRRRLPLSGRVRPTGSVALGGAILAENRTRADIDLVLTLSPFDEELERWIGARRVAWLPRSIISNPLRWTPNGEYLGFVGTLDHAPNLEGLVLTIDALQSDSTVPRIRVVGGPDSVGQWLDDRYPCVDYLGRLDDLELEQEAATWNAFIHPVFCQARGCSTKLATALAWQIPIVTTTIGHRGYQWQSGALVVADDPKGFAQRCISMLDSDKALTAQRGVVEVVRSSPGVEQNVARLRDILATEGAASQAPPTATLST